jgi:hypothetical protein
MNFLKKLNIAYQGNTEQSKWLRVFSFWFLLLNLMSKHYNKNVESTDIL